MMIWFFPPFRYSSSYPASDWPCTQEGIDHLIHFPTNRLCCILIQTEEKMVFIAADINRVFWLRVGNLKWARRGSVTPTWNLNLIRLYETLLLVCSLKSSSNYPPTPWHQWEDSTDLTKLRSTSFASWMTWQRCGGMGCGYGRLSVTSGQEAIQYEINHRDRQTDARTIRYSVNLIKLLSKQSKLIIWLVNARNVDNLVGLPNVYLQGRCLLAVTFSI